MMRQKSNLLVDDIHLNVAKDRLFISFLATAQISALQPQVTCKRKPSERGRLLNELDLRHLWVLVVCKRGSRVLAMTGLLKGGSKSVTVVLSAVRDG